MSKHKQPEAKPTIRTLDFTVELNDDTGNLTLGIRTMDEFTSIERLGILKMFERMILKSLEKTENHEEIPSRNEP